MKATIHDVAKFSGVSIGTVSRVLNDRPGVKPVTKVKVEKAMKELGYIPESAARDLPKGKRLTIGIHLTEGTLHLAPFSVLFFQAVIRKTSNLGNRVIDLPSRPDGLPYLNVDGIILLGAHKGDPRIDFLENQKVPYVLIGHDIGKSWVAPDDYDGGRQAAKYLLAGGHREFLFVCSRMDYQNTIDRLKGFSEHLASAGCRLKDSQIISGADTPLEAYRRFASYIKKYPEEIRRATAVFAISDEIAIGIKAALEDAGFDIPRDYSIVGYDDMPELAEDLTTVHQNIPEIAGISIKLLQDQIEGKQPGYQIVPVQLVVRGSSGNNINLA